MNLINRWIEYRGSLVWAHGPWMVSAIDENGRLTLSNPHRGELLNVRIGSVLV